MNYVLAVDIGASSGRHILGWIEDGKMLLEEIYRFKNGAEKVGEKNAFSACITMGIDENKKIYKLFFRY